MAETEEGENGEGEDETWFHVDGSFLGWWRGERRVLGSKVRAH